MDMIRLHSYMKPIKPTLRKDGRWEAKGIDPATAKRKSYYSRGDQGRGAVKQALESFGIQRDDSFLAYFAAAYVPSVETRSENWKVQIAWAMDNWFLPWFGASDIREIKRADIQRHVNYLATQLASPKSVSNVYKVISAVFSLAEADEVIPRSPCQRIRLPEIPEADKTALTFEQLWALKEASHALVKPFVILAGFCGGHRLGEACGQTWRLTKGCLHIQQQVQQYRGRVEVTPRLKTPQSNRLVPVPAELMAELRACGQVSDIWICSNSEGGYMLPKNIARELAAACRRAGLVQRGDDGSPVLAKDGKPAPLISPNELRHTYISLMQNELEAPAHIVERLTGKAKSGNTAPYSHTEMQQLARWQDRYWEEAKRRGREASAEAV
jgi:integrase